MYFSIFGAFITIVLNLWLIPTIGIMAAAYATLIAYFSMTLVSYLIGKKHYPVPYNIVKMSIYLTASILICYLSFNYFRNNYLMSFIFVILFGILIYFNERKELAVILKRK
jgi:O-antigen/teichoic acid export membrane protein